MKKDNIFNKELKKQFEFDEEVASVFDDMLSRSVPFYKPVIDICVDFIIKNTEKDDKILDLGCSTATLLLELNRKSSHELELKGIDNSSAMIDRARAKAKAFNTKIELTDGDILEQNFENENGAIISNYTLQFIRPMKREELLQKIYNSLKKDGIFIFSEKVITDDTKLNKQLIEYYFQFKKSQGYSDLEIVQKREALENVLIPYTEQENIKLAKKVGFKYVNTLFKWVNFTTFIARKG